MCVLWITTVTCLQSVRVAAVATVSQLLSTNVLDDLEEDDATLRYNVRQTVHSITSTGFTARLYKVLLS